MKVGIEAETITAGQAIDRFTDDLRRKGYIRAFRSAAGVVKRAAEASTEHGDLTGAIQKKL